MVERQARPADELDAAVRVDGTRTLEPLERTSERERGEAPETHPTAREVQGARESRRA